MEFTHIFSSQPLNNIVDLRLTQQMPGIAHYKSSRDDLQSIRTVGRFYANSSKFYTIASPFSIQDLSTPGFRYVRTGEVSESTASKRPWQSDLPFWLCRVAHLQQLPHTEGLECRCTQESPATEALLTCRVVLWSEKGELKKVVTMLITISVTYFSRIESACFLSLVLLQAWKTVGCWKWDTQTYSRILRNPLPPALITNCRTEVQGFIGQNLSQKEVIRANK